MNWCGFYHDCKARAKSGTGQDPHCEDPNCDATWERHHNEIEFAKRIRATGRRVTKRRNKCGRKSGTGRSQ